MSTLMSGRVSTVVTAVLALAVATSAAHAQQAPRWHVEASLDATGPDSYASIIADGPDGGFTFKQQEAIRYSVGAARLLRVGRRASVRVGASLSNKGFNERRTSATGSSVNHVDLLYLGAPVALGYNLVNGGPGLRLYAEGGIAPELLLREDESELGLDLLGTGVSYLLSLGLRYDLGTGRAVTLGPEYRSAVRGYTRHTPNTAGFYPQTMGLKLGVQF